MSERELKEKNQERTIPFTFQGLEEQARAKLSKEVFGYVASGAGTEQTLRKNLEAFDQLTFRPHTCMQVDKVYTEIELLGTKLPFPILFAPVGNQKQVHPDGELASARAANSLQIPYIASTVSSYTIEQIAKANGNGKRWFQLYSTKDDEVTLNLVKRAEQNGYSAIVLTVDMAQSWRVRDMKNNFLPFSRGQQPYPNLVSDPVFQQNYQGKLETDSLENTVRSIFPNSTFTWKKLKKLSKKTSLPILVKGILNPEDARLAIQHGAKGIIVSNHGGRMLDGCMPAINALTDIVKEVDRKVPVLFDSGIRSAKDVMIALIMGADAVLIGRPFVYGLALNGEKGVQTVFLDYFEEFRRSMRLAGISSIHQLKKLKLYNIK